jgi:NCAIR mutase (PurE)-related protein
MRAAVVHASAKDAAALKRARVVIAVAGEKGELPGEIADVVDAPVIGVPTSSHTQADTGRFALRTMLRASARGVPAIGVAGIHRLFDALPALLEADVIVAAAGMEGTLPGIVAGLVRSPLVAIPMSVGYGVSAGGAAALNAMLASCVPGQGVMGIDEAPERPGS